MYELVELKGNDVFTNSKVIADGTNNQHESVVAIIRKYEKDILDFLRFKIGEKGTAGKSLLFE